MRKIISIPIILLILFSGITVNFATHYCMGSVAAVKVSLDGELATCGMENHQSNTYPGDIYSNHCCDNISSAYTLFNNYLPSDYSIRNPDYQIIYVIDVPSISGNIKETYNNNSDRTLRPPGTFSPTSVNRPALCIFRI